MNKIILNLILFLFPFTLFAQAERIISLAGQWYFKIDSLAVGEQEHWERKTFTESIHLPGSTDEAGIGNTIPIFKSILGCDRFSDYPEEADFGMVTRKHKYIGKVWYQKDFNIDHNFEGEYTLLLERVMWQSKVWIDGRLVSDPVDYLSSPHQHHLGPLSKGKHRLTILVDNSEIYPIGVLGHSYCPHMQTQWNGIVGKIEIQQVGTLNLKQADVFPSFAERKIGLQLNIENKREKNTPIKLSFTVLDKQTNEIILKSQKKKTLAPGNEILSLELPIKDPKPWNEFTPNLYQLKIEWKTNGISFSKLIDFGFRDLGIKDKHFTINGEKILYRNNHEGMFFAQTGYPATDVAYWKNIWKLYKKHGFNAVRFHSSCPPEAAFIAADEVGLYMQVEFFWKDGWMGWKDLIGGNDARLNQFAIDEVKQALLSYGNHPSMMLVSFGNELGGNFDWMGEQIAEFKKKDNRHFYAAGIAHNITLSDDFVEYGGKHQAQNQPGTDWNYTYNYTVPEAHNYDSDFRRKNLPEFTHETGQYIVHPLWSEIDKYKGVLDPLNLKYYRSLAEKNGIANMDEELQRASGQINKNLYKAEIEATLRTPESAGYSLLSMVDYPGQGEALVGWVNPFYENKNFMTPEEFSMFGTHTVPLLRFPKYVWEDGEIFNGDIEIVNYGEKSLQSEVLYQIEEEGKIVYSGKFPSILIPQGKTTSIGQLQYTVNSGSFGKKLEIQISIKDTSYKNRWSIWVFPKNNQERMPEKVLLTKSLQEAISQLRNGGKVLLLADQLGEKKNKIYSAFDPVFWSATWFVGQDTDVSGAYIRNTHPALALFPTDDVLNWQWKDICAGSHGFILNDLAKEYYPIVQPVNDFHHGNKLGTIFEFKTKEGGKLLVCGYNLVDSLDKRPAAKQLRESLISYTESDQFNPTYEIEYSWLEKNLKDYSFENEKEKSSMNALLYVLCGEKHESASMIPWNKDQDKVLVNEDDFDYHVDCEGVWSGNEGSYWVGKQIDIKVKVQSPKLLELKLCLSDPNDSGRTGVITCEDMPPVELKKHEAETWVSIPVTRENCLDGELRISIQCKSGPNLMIRKCVIVPKK